METKEKESWLIKPISLYKNSPDIPKIAYLLTKAFFNYPAFKFIFPNGSKRGEILRKYFTMFVNYFILCGYWKVAIEEGFRGVIFWTEGPEKETLWSFMSKILRCGLLGVFWKSPGSFNRWIKWMEDDEKAHEETISIQHTYIGILGVDPEFKGKGIGKDLVGYVVKQAGEKAQTIYAETHSEENTIFFKKLGFTVQLKEGSAGMIYTLLKS